MRRAAAAWTVLTLVLASTCSREAFAEGPSKEGTGSYNSRSKDLGLHSPRGRRIYRDEADIESVVDSRGRVFVIEAAVGAGPEGNLGMVFGWMPKEIHGLEFYAGAGIEANPAYHLSGAARFLFNIRGYRPYLGLGYFYKDAYVIDTYVHNAFLEGGYSMKLGATNHLSFGLGVARLLYTGVRTDSVLRSPEVNAASLEEQLDGVPRWLPMFTARFSRAF